MAKLRRGVHSAMSDDTSLRLRAAWLYHAFGMTQNEVADQLGVGRSTVIRLLEDARARGEVKIWIDEGDDESIELALKLERALKLDEAIVVPSDGSIESASKAVGLALGLASGLVVIFGGLGTLQVLRARPVPYLRSE